MNYLKRVEEMLSYLKIEETDRSKTPIDKSGRAFNCGEIYGYNRCIREQEKKVSVVLYELSKLLHDFSEELLGEDEETYCEPGAINEEANRICNQLRAEQRKKVSKLLGRKHE